MISTAPSQELKLIATHQTYLCMLLMSLHTIEMELLDIGFAVHKLQQTAAEVPQEMSQQWNDLQEKRALIDAQIRVTAHSVENLAATLGF